MKDKKEEGYFSDGNVVLDLQRLLSKYSHIRASRNLTLNCKVGGMPILRGPIKGERAMQILLDAYGDSILTIFTNLRCILASPESLLCSDLGLWHIGANC